jgi:hypothetical protein
MEPGLDIVRRRQRRVFTEIEHVYPTFVHPTSQVYPVRGKANAPDRTARVEGEIRFARLRVPNDHFDCKNKVSVVYWAMYGQTVPSFGKTVVWDLGKAQHEPRPFELPVANTAFMPSRAPRDCALQATHVTPASWPRTMTFVFGRSGWFSLLSSVSSSSSSSSTPVSVTTSEVSKSSSSSSGSFSKSTLHTLPLAVVTR